MVKYTLESGARGSGAAKGTTTVVTAEQIRLDLTQITDIMIFRDGGPRPTLGLIKVDVRRTRVQRPFSAWFKAEKVIPRGSEAREALLTKFVKYKGEDVPNTWP